VRFAAPPTKVPRNHIRSPKPLAQRYAIARAGVFWRSRDGVTPFEQGPTLFDEDKELILRHAAIDLEGDHLSVYYSRIGDRPERILLSRILLRADWKKWRASSPITILSQDPGIFREDGKTYLLYSIAGESGIAIAELRPQ
jgi:hypothetical protein